MNALVNATAKRARGGALVVGAIGAALLTPALALAQVTPAPEAPDVPRAFDVEIIVFRPLQASNLDERQWLEANRALSRSPDGAGNDSDDGFGFDSPRQGNAALPGTATDWRAPSDTGSSPYPPSPRDSRWQAPSPEHHATVRESSFEMGELHRRLRLSGGFRPLAHQRWRQFAYPRQEARGRALSIEVDGLMLSGTVTVAVERLLHLTVDLTLQEPNKIAYQLNQSRVMRSEETHYIDHPAFGVICRITRAEFPQGFPQAFLPELLASDALLADPSDLLRPLPTPIDELGVDTSAAPRRHHPSHQSGLKTTVAKAQ